MALVVVGGKCYGGGGKEKGYRGRYGGPALRFLVPQAYPVHVPVHVPMPHPYPIVQTVRVPVPVVRHVHIPIVKMVHVPVHMEVETK